MFFVIVAWKAKVKHGEMEGKNVGGEIDGNVLFRGAAAPLIPFLAFVSTLVLADYDK